jgi:hypothetical protein
MHQTRFPLKRSPSITVAAIVALICGSLSLLFAGLGTIGVFLLGPADYPTAQPMPPFAKAAGMIGLGIFFGWSAWVIAAGIGLLRLRSWARISILIQSGLVIFFGTISLLVTFNMPFPSPRGSDVDVQSFLHVFLAILYGLPILIGVWWLILFNRKGVRAQFTDQKMGEAPVKVQKPRVPLAVSIIAWFFIAGSCFVFYPLLYSSRVPLMLFGRSLGGRTGTVILIAACGLQLASGIGLLRLKRWSYPLAMAHQLFWVTSAIFNLLSPNFVEAMRQAIKITGSLPPGMDAEAFLRFVMRAATVGSLMPLVVLGILIYYRNRFLESADRAANAP